MKKLILILLSTILLTGCTPYIKNNIPVAIEDAVWKMDTAQGNSGEIIACSEETSVTYPEAWKLNVILTASDGVLEIRDTTNNLNFYGEYRLNDKDFTVTSYSVTTDSTYGYIVLSKRKFVNEEAIDVLILAVGDYVLNFYKQ